MHLWAYVLRRSVGHIFGCMQIAASTVVLERVVPREPRQRLLTGFHGHNSFKRHCITAKTWFRIENPGIVQERPDMRVPMNTAVLERVAPLWKQVNELRPWGPDKDYQLVFMAQSFSKAISLVILDVAY